VDFKPGEVGIAPNGVDLKAYTDLPEPPQARKALSLAEKPTALFSGHLYAGRGADLMLRMAQNLPEVQFVWVGGHPEDVAAWKARIASQGLTNIILTGFIENGNCRSILLPGMFFSCPTSAGLPAAAAAIRQTSAAR